MSISQHTNQYGDKVADDRYNTTSLYDVGAVENGGDVRCAGSGCSTCRSLVDAMTDEFAKTFSDPNGGWL